MQIKKGKVLKNKRILFNKIAEIVEKKFCWIISSFAVISVMAPIIVWLFYSVIPCNVYTDITADGMLTYVGTIIGSCATVFVAFIAIYQGQRTIQLEEMVDAQMRKSEICPSLQIQIEKIEKDFFEITIENNGSQPAIGIYIFEYPFIHNVKPKKAEKKKFIVGTERAGVLSVDKSYIEYNSKGLPKIITLVFGDVDNNIISQEFCASNAGEEYEARQIEYC